MNDGSDGIAVVTGGAGGFGTACVELLTASGYQVCALDSDAEGIDRLVARTPRTLGIVADVGDEASVDAAVSDIVARFGRIDALVNNAGISPPSCWLHETSLASWRRVLDIDLTSVFLCTKACLPVMTAQRKGSIVNVSSILGVVGIDPSLLRQASYAAAKAGIIGLTMQTAAEYGSDGVRCNAITPGWHTDTNLAEGSGNFRDPAAATVLQRSIAARTALGRSGTAPELARLVRFLVSDESSYITGAIIPHDGGWTAL